MIEGVIRLLNKMSQHEKKPSMNVILILQKGEFFVERFLTKKKKRKKNKPWNKEANILQEEFSKNCVTICQICGGSSDTTHTVSITENLIFDSTFVHALPLNKKSLDVCVGSNAEYTGCPLAYRVTHNGSKAYW